MAAGCAWCVARTRVEHRPRWASETDEPGLEHGSRRTSRVGAGVCTWCVQVCARGARLSPPHAAATTVGAEGGPLRALAAAWDAYRHAHTLVWCGRIEVGTDKMGEGRAAAGGGWEQDVRRRIAGR